MARWVAAHGALWRAWHSALALAIGLALAGLLVLLLGSWPASARPLPLKSTRTAGVSRSAAANFTVMLPLFTSTAPAVDRWQPAFSPDGRQVVFTSGAAGKMDVYVSDASFDPARRLTYTAGEDTPTFSPDGARILFASNRTDRWAIYLMQPDGDNVQQVASHNTADVVHPAWAPDGQCIAFASNREGGNWDIYTTTLATGPWVRLTSDAAIEKFPSFSPDGRQLAYRREDAGNSEIYVMDLASLRARRLTDNPANDTYAGWAADGSGLIFASDRGGALGVYSTNPAGFGVRPVVVRPGHTVFTPRLSYDGHVLAYADAPIDGTYALYTATYASPLETLAGSATTGQCDWGAGVQAIGWSGAWRASGQGAYLARLRTWVESCSPATFTVTHVNDGPLAYAALVLYETEPQPDYLLLAQRAASFFLYQSPRTRDGTLIHGDATLTDTVWLDTLMGVVPFYIEMSRVTGDELYLTEAARQFLLHSQHLQETQDPSYTGLYHHAWQEHTGGYRSATYWGRGQAWAALAGADLMAALPITHTLRSAVLEAIQRHAQAVAAAQDPGGLWHTVLNRPDFYLETSGSAGLTYGLACGVSGGWLSPALRAAVSSARLALWGKVNAEGKLLDVSEPTGPMTDEALYGLVPHGAAQLYGQGLGLLALGTCQP